MKKRIISFLLSAVIVFGLLAAAAPSVSAAYNMKASDQIIELIKYFEGCATKPYEDNGHWSVGYGCEVSGDDLVKYQANGITLQEADALLRSVMPEYEKNVNTFAKLYSLNLSQSQFDALVSFTYNLGANWMNNSSALRQAILDGTTGDDFVFAFTRWCTASNEVQANLIQRRLIEANVYLNSVYSTSIPSSFRYVVYDDNIENPVVNTVRVQGFETSAAREIRSTPTKSGYRFLGWYTAETGGEWVSVLSAGVNGNTLYAHWQEGNGETDADGNVVGKEAKYERTLSAAKTVRKNPGESAAQIKNLSSGTKVTIVSDYMDASGTKWGELSSGGWISLSDTAGDVVVTKNEFDPAEVTATGVIVKTSTLNVRSGPGTKNPVVAKYIRGTKVQISKQEKVGSTTWGLTENGWISLYYVQLIDEEETVPEATEPSDTKQPETSNDQVIATGVVTGCNALNVRSGAGVKNSLVGRVTKGTTVEIYEQTVAGRQKWGRISQGWICLEYVTLTAADTGSSGSSENTGSEDADAPGSESTAVTGTVIRCTNLNVRSGAGVNNAWVGKLPKGTKVEIYETTKVGSSTWGRTSLGWVHMYYIKLDSASTGTDNTGTSGSTDTGSAGSGTTDSTESTGTATQTGTVVNTDKVRVRSAAGVKNKQVGTLSRGTKVTIYVTTKVGSSTWGRTSQGWVHMYYIQLDSGTVPAGSIVRTVTASGLRIRSGPGLDTEILGSYNKGTRVEILEQTTVNGRPWGHTDKGWISLDHVK